MRTIEAPYWLQSVVYLRTRKEELAGMVTCVSIRPSGVSFGVTWGTGVESYHYDFELSATFVPEWEKETSATEKRRVTDHELSRLDAAIDALNRRISDADAATLLMEQERDRLQKQRHERAEMLREKTTE